MAKNEPNKLDDKKIIPASETPDKNNVATVSEPQKADGKTTDNVISLPEKKD